MFRHLSIIFVALFVFTATSSNHKKHPESSKTFTLYSSAFSDGDYLPDTYSCSGKGISPPLSWKYAPSGTKQFFLYLKSDVYRDRYDYLYTRVDWTLYNIDADVEKIQSDNSGNVGTAGGTYPGDSMHEYNAPCPTVGNACECHTYEYVLVALNGDLASSVADQMKSGSDTADIGYKMYEAADEQKMIAGTAELSVQICNESGCSFKPNKERKQEHAR